MSEADFVEPSSESFWEIGQYKRTVKRCEDGYKLCNDIVQMIAERADLEKQYSKSLKAWSKRWNDYLQKGSEYGSMKSTWMSSLQEADKLAEIHLTTHNVLNEELSREIKEWQKQNYPKSIVNQLKTAKEYEEEFKKAQKPWGKKYAVVEKTKKEYHSACKSYQTAKVQCANSQNDPAISADQKKKFEDKVEKYKKECEITKSKYKQALEDLNSYNSHYIEDMNNVYKKCDNFEKERLEFFIQKFIKLHGHLNIYEKMNIEDVYNEFLRTIKQTNPERDLFGWSKEFGSGMPMNWPVFEEYSEELKTIAKGNKAAKLNKDMNVDNNGVTMTSIKHKSDDLNDDNRSYLSSATDLANQRSKMQTEDPWGDTSPSFTSQRSNEFASSFDDNSNWKLDESRQQQSMAKTGKNTLPFHSRTLSTLQKSFRSKFHLNSKNSNCNLNLDETSRSQRSTKTLTNTNTTSMNSLNMTSNGEQTTLSNKSSSNLTTSTLPTKLSPNNRVVLTSSDIIRVDSPKKDNKAKEKVRVEEDEDFYPDQQNPFNDLDEFSDEDEQPSKQQQLKSSSPPPAKSSSPTKSNESIKIKKSSPPAPVAEQTTSSTVSDADKNEQENENSTVKSNSKQSNGNTVANPFGGEDSDDDDSNKVNASVTHSAPPPAYTNNGTDLNNDDSDDDHSTNQAAYLNVKVKALYDYASTEDDELSFKAGEEFIKLAPEDERGWCLGKIGNKVGLYPATYAANA